MQKEGTAVTLSEGLQGYILDNMPGDTLEAKAQWIDMQVARLMLLSTSGNILDVRPAKEVAEFAINALTLLLAKIEGPSSAEELAAIMQNETAYDDRLVEKLVISMAPTQYDEDKPGELWEHARRIVAARKEGTP